MARLGREKAGKTAKQDQNAAKRDQQPGPVYLPKTGLFNIFFYLIMELYDLDNVLDKLYDLDNVLDKLYDLDNVLDKLYDLDNVWNIRY